MKIACFHNYYQQSGGEDAVFTAEVNLLKQKGHQVFTYQVHNNDLAGMNPVRASINTIWSGQSYQQISRFLQDTKPDIAHFHNTFLMISPAAYYACQKLGVPVVQTLHNYRLFCPAGTFFREDRVCEACLGKTPPLPAIRYACYHHSQAQSAVVATMLTFHRWLHTWQKQVDVFIALTEFTREKAITGGLPADKIIVKPNFIKTALVARPALSREGFLFVGRLSDEKGIKTLLEAWRNLPHIPLKIIGDGPLFTTTDNFIKTYRLNNIQLLGRQSYQKVLEFMQQATALVFPSQWFEGFPMTILEAFASGLPVVASKLGSMEEIVIDNHNGLHFTAGDSKSLVEKVNWAIKHPVKMKQFGENARATYECAYTAEENYRQLIEIYETAKKKHKVR